VGLKGKQGTWDTSAETRYVYDGMRVIQERNSSNVPQVTYTRGLDLGGSLERAGGIGGLLARTAHSGGSGGTYTPAFYHADGNGNVTYLLTAGQTLGASYKYDPYGRNLSSSGSLSAANTLQFSSKMLTSAGYYYGYRFYDPNTQRWLTRDPIEEDGGINLYQMVYGNPVNRADAYGECALLIEGGVALVVGVAILVVTPILVEHAKNYPIPIWPSLNNGSAGEGDKGRSEPAPATPPTAAPAPPVAEAPAKEEAGPQIGDRYKEGQAEERLDGIREAQDNAKKNRPKTKGKDANPEWEGFKRPKQSQIEKIRKSEQNADYECRP